MLSISHAIRQARLDANLSQVDLAARAGTSQPALARYETGTALPTLPTLERLLAACGRRRRSRRPPPGVSAPSARFEASSARRRTNCDAGAADCSTPRKSTASAPSGLRVSRARRSNGQKRCGSPRRPQTRPHPPRPRRVSPRGRRDSRSTRRRRHHRHAQGPHPRRGTQRGASPMSRGRARAPSRHPGRNCRDSRPSQAGRRDNRRQGRPLATRRPALPVRGDRRGRSS